MLKNERNLTVTRDGKDKQIEPELILVGDLTSFEESEYILKSHQKY